MPITFRCTSCRQMLSVSRKKAGAKLNCPACKASIQVPSLEPSPAAADDAATLVDAPELVAGSKAAVEEFSPGTAHVNPPSAPPADSPDVEAAEEGFEDDAPTTKEPAGDSAIASSKPRDESQTPGVTPKTPAPPVEIRPSAKPLHEDDEEDEEEPYVSKQKFERDAIDMTAMVDVTFLLLIFFMVTASFAAQKVMERSAPQPEESSEGAAAITATTPDDEMPENSVIVEIDANDQITFEGRRLAGLGELRDNLISAFNADPEVAVIIQAQYSAKHGTLVSASDAAMSAGISRIIPQVSPDDE